MRVDPEQALQLERALARLQEGEDRLEELQSHDAEVSAELRALVEQAAILRERFEPPGPDRAYVSSTRFRLLNRISAPADSAGRARPARRKRTLWGSLQRPALALASLFLVIALLLSSTGVAYAASRSLPGDPLYRVKRTYERARVTLALNEEQELQLRMRHTNRRMEEIQALERAGRLEDMAFAASQYAESLDALLVDLAADGTEDQYSEAEAALARHTQVLEGLLSETIEGEATGLENALLKSSHGEEVLQALLEGRSPSELAPGELKKTETPGEEGEGRGPDQTPPGQDPDRTPGPPDGEGPPGLEGKGTPGPPPEEERGGGPPEGKGGGPPDGYGGGPPVDPGKGNPNKP